MSISKTICTIQSKISTVSGVLRSVKTGQLSGFYSYDYRDIFNQPKL